MNLTPEQVAHWRQATGDLIVHSRTGASWSFTDESLQHFAALARAWQAEQDAKSAEEFGPSRPIVSRNPSQIVIGRWEGEQAASKNIAAAIRANAPKVTR